MTPDEIRGAGSGAFWSARAFFALVVLVDVDEAVALFHLAGAGGDEVDGAPGAVVDEVDAVFIDVFFICSMWARR